MGHGWDAIVVGAGPAGSALSALLARDGWRVALLDASSFPRQKLCGEHLASGAQPLLAALGVAEDVCGRSLPIKKISLVASLSHRLTVEAGSDRSPAPVAIDRYRFDELLVNRALQAGAELRPACRVRSVLVENGTVQGVLAKDASSQAPAERLTAPVIVAADGRHSAIVRQTARIVRNGPPLVGFKQHFAASNLDAAPEYGLTMYSLPGGYAGVAPLSDGNLNVCGVMPRHLLPHAAGGFEQTLGKWLAIYPILKSLVSQPPIHPWLTIASVSTQFAHPQVPGVLYVGDALGTIEPFTGQGMTMALASAWIAYRVLAGAPAARPPSFADQQRYAAVWRSLFGRRIYMASAVAQLLRRPRVIQAITLVDCLRADLGTRIFQAVYDSLPVSISRLESLAEPHASTLCQLPETASCGERR